MKISKILSLLVLCVGIFNYSIGMESDSKDKETTEEGIDYCKVLPNEIWYKILHDHLMGDFIDNLNGPEIIRIMRIIFFVSQDFRSSINIFIESSIWAEIIEALKYSKGKTREELGKELIESVKGENIERVRFLILSGANLNAEDEKGLTPLMWVAMNGNVEVFALLSVFHGIDVPDVNKQDNSGDTTLMHSISNGQKEITKRLIDIGVDLNKQNKLGNSALIVAVKNNDKEIAQMLIDADADLSKTNIHYMTALLIAQDEDHTEIVEMLLSTIFI